VAANSLVLVAPIDAPFVFDDEVEPLGDSFAGFLAIGEPEHVPEGAYAKQALQRAGWWDALAPRVVGASDARAALALVERGECAAGIVYASDARSSERVQEVWEVPGEIHDPIVYWAVAVGDSIAPATAAWIDRLRSAATAELLARGGFRAAP
jgi:molybdate transport system substrate-binding protein